MIKGIETIVMDSIYDYIALATGITIIVLILMQTRGASLGAGFGGGGEEGGMVRRGSEKTIHQITIILVVVFACSLLVGLLF